MRLTHGSLESWFKIPSNKGVCVCKREWEKEKMGKERARERERLQIKY